MRKAVSRIIPSRSRSSSENEGSLNSPFKIDFQSVSDFYIILDNPHNSWLPGDEVSGQIILISKKNLANVVITLSLIGFVKINASSHSKLRPIRHNLFNHTIKIYGDNATPQPQDDNQQYSNGLFKGEHRFPFIVKLPNKRVFTSIDFGKGSISYVLKASMTDSTSQNELTSNNLKKLNTINSENNSSSLLSKTKNLKFLHNSNFTSEKIINLINPIDVSSLPPPRPKKLIIKDPRANRKLSRTQSSNSTINTFNTYSTFSSNNSDPNDSISTHTRDDEGTTDAQDTPASTANGQPPLPTTNSSSNVTTVPNFNNGHLQVQFEEDHGPSTPIPSSVSYDSPKPETIKVSMTIPQRGYLRGENIPIKINVSHLRKIQDINGIILTFVRVCRLDNGPEGLFDSFRKDLSQSVIPLYVDPVTLKSEIKSNIRVPADAFPTISGCPLVSFQYFVEVLINLSGKSVLLDVNDTAKPSSSENGHPSPLIDFQNQSSANVNEDNDNNNEAKTLNEFKRQFQYLSGSFDFNQKERSSFINTDKYKRMKKFLQLTSEVIIGTHRSPNFNSTTNRMDIQDSNSPASHRSSTSSNSPAQPLHQQTQIQPSIPEVEPIEFNNISHDNELDNSIPNYDEVNVNLIPMPNLQLTEKERVKAHETSLLPSEPQIDLQEESPESISPIERDDGMLMDGESQPEVQDLQEIQQHQEQEQEQEQQDYQMHDNFNFFEISNNETIDYVPNYEKSTNDQLVESQPNP
ncbi:pH-response regulator protein palF/RIM8 [[Candida] jaroonii]|uniref:PH-response regulator protein palF/RIM8 n=1 Tax=[Candida] jaroonii TaxID=467808 RepID=A0ACA9YB37_9ASCO|nr:pH-response regulator protein palF/RIM8 [[Candida] jaroonii]